LLELATKLARALSCDLAKSVREMKFIIETEGFGNFLVAQIAFGHQDAGLVDEPRGPVTRW
jgi:hypothetical protein